MNHLDLFSGIGGFALGAYWAGWRFGQHYFSEVDDYATKVYRQRFPDAIPLGDITKIEELPKGKYIITGGFPCVDISDAGPRTGITGHRSGLWRELVRTIRMVRPVVALVENVAALLGRGMGRVLGDLA
ncbi:MAG: DNA cytosine methyltransferase, partial [Hyphomicrobiaceae bacterium]|nr:DNA cytosine methyltransferase [Hyphomicrobiaceae bacterium]